MHRQIVTISAGVLIALSGFSSRARADSMYVGAGASNGTASLVSYDTTATSPVPTMIATGLDPIRGLAVDGAGNVYAAIAAENTIVKYTPGGSLSTFASAGLDGPYGLAFDSSGNLFAANYNTGTIVEYTPGGSPTTFATGLTRPDGLAFGASGDLYVANSGFDGPFAGKITRITPSGLESAFASGNIPMALAFDASGNLYVGNWNSGTIDKVTPAGVDTIFATLTGRPYDLAFDSAGNLFVSEQRQIEKITPGGVVSTFVTTASDAESLVIVRAQTVPEPVGLIMLGTGAVGLLGSSCRRRRARGSAGPSGLAPERGANMRGR